LLTEFQELWDRFFGQINDEITNMRQNFQKMYAEISTQLGEILGTVTSVGGANLPEDVLRSKIEQLQKRNNVEQKQFYNVVTHNVQAAMQEAYNNCKSAKGVGTKKIIHDILQTASAQEIMYNSAAKGIQGDMERSRNAIHKLIQNAISELKKTLRQYYEIYWNKIKDKYPFECLFKEIIASKKEHEERLESALAEQNGHSIVPQSKRTQKKTRTNRFKNEIKGEGTDDTIARSSRKARNTKRAAFTLSSQEAAESTSNKRKRTTSSEIENWEVQDVQNWIKSTDFAQYADKFLQEEVAGCHLINLTEQQLKDHIGIPTLAKRMNFIKLVKAERDK